MSILTLIEKITGLDKIKKQAIDEAAKVLLLAREAESAAKEAQLLKEKAEADAERIKTEIELSKKTPKEIATQKHEPWVAVLETHVNKNNIRHGFFELDWNKYFIDQLISEGYGVANDPEEEVVDRWFRELCANVVIDGDYGGPLDTGMIDINAAMNNLR